MKGHRALGTRFRTIARGPPATPLCQRKWEKLAQSSNGTPRTVTTGTDAAPRRPQSNAAARANDACATPSPWRSESAPAHRPPQPRSRGLSFNLGRPFTAGSWPSRPPKGASSVLPSLWLQPPSRHHTAMQAGVPLDTRRLRVNVWNLASPIQHPPSRPSINSISSAINNIPYPDPGNLATICYSGTENNAVRGRAARRTPAPGAMPFGFAATSHNRRPRLSEFPNEPVQARFSRLRRAYSEPLLPPPPSPGRPPSGPPGGGQFKSRNQHPPQITILTGLAVLRLVHPAFCRGGAAASRRPAQFSDTAAGPRSLQPDLNPPKINPPPRLPARGDRGTLSLSCHADLAIFNLSGF